jgi:hypothetical protein
MRSGRIAINATAPSRSARRAYANRASRGVARCPHLNHQDAPSRRELAKAPKPKPVSVWSARLIRPRSPVLMLESADGAVSCCQGTSQFGCAISQTACPKWNCHAVEPLTGQSDKQIGVCKGYDTRIGHRVTGIGSAPYYPRSRKRFQDVAAVMRH